MEKEREDTKLVRLGGESVDLTRTAFRIVQARDNAEMNEGWRGEESEDSGEDGFSAGEGKVEGGRETGDGEEEAVDGEREEVNEADSESVDGQIGENHHLEDEEDGDEPAALFEEDEMDDMFRSSNLIIIPFPRQDRNCSNLNSDPDIDDENSDPGANEEAAVQEEREEVKSDNSSTIGEELGKDDNEDHSAEENTDKRDQVQLRICFPPGLPGELYFSSQASDLSRQLVDVGRQLKSWRRSLNHCQPSKLRALVHRCKLRSGLDNSLGPLTCSLPDRCPQIA